MKDLLRNTAKLGAGIALACGVVTQGCHMNVDSVPPPPPPQGFCENPDTLLVRRSILTDATWVRDGRHLTIHIKLRSIGSGGLVSFGAPQEDAIHVSGARIKRLDAGLEEVDLVLLPLRGSDKAELSLAMHCDVRQIPLRYELDLRKPHQKRGYIPVELVK
jgi:hypothetical protein